MPRLRTPRPRLGKCDNRHGQSIHGRMLSEIEKLEAAQSDLDDSWIDELEEKCRISDAESARISLEHEAWQHRFDEYIQRRALGYRARNLEELGFDNLIRYSLSIMSGGQSDMERPKKPSPYVTKTDDSPTPELVISRVIA